MRWTQIGHDDGSWAGPPSGQTTHWGPTSAALDVRCARDLPCDGGPAVADLRGDIVGAPRRFVPYSRAIARLALALGLAGVGAKLDPASLEVLVRYPEVATRCVWP